MLDKNKYQTKPYLHFDHRIKIEKAESYVTNPSRIAKHSFLPLLYFPITADKYTGETNSDLDNKPIKRKTRHIMYAGHLDSYIYKYYAEVLNNEFYNQYCDRVGIDDCVIAYRNNKPNKSNIDFAAEVIASIVAYKNCYIYVGDFTKYFDKIDHAKLKANLSKVMGQCYLEKDWYNIFRSITKYGYYEKDRISLLLGSDSAFKSKGEKSYFKKISHFRNFQRENPPEYNNKKFGIPQGTAISAVFANVYASNFDSKISSIANKHNGLYRRYSDDFILVVPHSELVNEKYFKELSSDIKEFASNCEIYLNDEKSEYLKFYNNLIYNLGNNEIGNLDYLGFVFNGTRVSMRGKSPYKFYRQAKKLISLAQKVKKAKKLEGLPYQKKIYGLYTDLGGKYGKHGNFIDYARNAQFKFDTISPNTENLIMNQIKNRKKRIENLLGIKIHSKI